MYMAVNSSEQDNWNLVIYNVQILIHNFEYQSIKSLRKITYLVYKFYKSNLSLWLNFYTFAINYMLVPDKKEQVLQHLKYVWVQVCVCKYTLYSAYVYIIHYINLCISIL